MRGTLRILGAFVAVAATVALQTDANALITQSGTAYSCSDATYGTSGTYFAALTGTRSTYTASCVADNTANAAGSVVTATTTLRAATAQTVGIISSRIAALRKSASKNGSKVTLTSMSLSQDLANGDIGLSGGNATKGLGFWVQGRYTHIDSNASAAKYDGNLISAMIGIDKRFAGDKALVGLSVGYERLDLDTDFNRGNLESDGIVIAPYVAYQINKTFSFEATGGYAFLDYDMDRLDSSTNAEKFTAKTQARRAFGAATLNAQMQKSKATFGAKLGATYSHEKKDAFTEVGQGTTIVPAGQNVFNAKSTTKLGQAIFGVSAAYDAGKAQPFISVTGEYDFNKTKAATVASTQTAIADDDFGLRVGAGVNVDVTDNISASLSGDGVFLRDDYKEYSGTVRIRAEF